MAYYHSSYGDYKSRRRKKINRRNMGILLIVLLILTALFGILVYNVFIANNVWTEQDEKAEIIIPSQSDFEQLKTIIYNKGLVINRHTFELVSKWLKYTDNVKAGRYLIPAGMNNLELVRLLRSGAQTPVQLSFNNIRDIYQLAGVVSYQIEADSTELVRLLTDSAYLSYLGYNTQSIPALFIPDTYEFYWTTDAERFVMRMFDEHRKFWNSSRRAKLEELQMTELDVSVLASIIDKETNKDDEKARMAGVYINRLKVGWRLQADPTLVFAAGDVEIRRVLDIHKTIESPYNTYKYSGLPPGPICIPTIASIEAVLNYEQHSYFYFCAKDDLSGYHAFASSLTQHEINAWRYRRALDQLNIKK
ncbi:MAG: endolytic transglycosylase MltG [Bacteroidales bacterium]|jgi:UPF0755 protein|nr:endolytic transglycosylase MltG [Bacteroidales bacterium]MDY0370646.1 endolytic transglycosylase MltG [Bacteroidales bacterium]